MVPGTLIPEIDWKITSIVVMLCLGIYNVAIRKFFKDGGDWRLMVPVAALVGLAALVYLAFIYKDLKFDNTTTPMLALALVTIGLVSLFSMMTYSHPRVQMSIAMPIMALAIVITTALSVLFLGENLTIQTVAGTVLAIAAIFILSWQ